MGKDLRSKLSNRQTSNSKTSNSKTSKPGRNVDEKKAKEATDYYNKYAGKSEDELKSTLFNMVNKGRKDGSFDNKQLENMAKQMGPMLDKQGRQKLNSIMNMLKTK